MKKIIIASLVAMSGLTAISSAMAAAPVHQELIRFECPNAAGGVASERLTNYGTSISGMGEINIGSSKKALPVFRGIPSAGVPLDLATGDYKHSFVKYNEHTGRVTCGFSSGNGADAFDVSYVAGNVKHGFVTKTDSNRTITVKVFQG